MVAMAKIRGVVLCACVTVMCWGGAAAQIGRNVHNITRSMLQEMTEEMGREPVRFSEPNINQPMSTASVQFDMRAMGLLYNCSPHVIDVIAKKDAYPLGIVTVSDGHFNIKPLKQEWRRLVLHYAGPTFIIVVAVLVIVVLPLAGLFWCCWYCCRMGRRRRPFDRKYDEWLKGVLSIILIGLLTLFLFGVVCAFATDSQVESSSAEASASLKAGVRDIRAFLNSTLAWTNTLLVVNYQEMQTSITRRHHSLGMSASWKLGAFSRAASVTTLNQMVQDLDSVQDKLRTVQSLTATLRVKAEELNSGLRKVKNQLLQTLAKCDQPKCRALQEKYKIGQLDTEIQYSQMPDVTDLLNNVTQLLDSGIKSDMEEGQKAFNDIQLDIQRSIDKRMPDVARSLAGIGEKLKGLANKLASLVKNCTEKLTEYEKYIEKYQEMYEQYGPYRRWAALAACCSLLLITGVLALGLTCGVCGARPAHARGACSKGTGASCLLGGIGIIFLLGSLVTAVMVAHFVLGVGATRFACDPLTEPRGNRLFADVDKMVDLEQSLFNERRGRGFNLTSAIVSCHANNTIYKALELSRLFNMKALRGSVRAELAARAAQLDAPRAHNALLRAGARDKLRRLADSGLSDFDFDRILSALETNMTSLALDPLAQQLNSTARSLQQPLFAAEAASLRRASAALAALQDDVLRPMMDISARLNDTARELRDDLRFNQSSLKETISFLVQETSAGQKFFNDMGKWNLQNVTSTITDFVSQSADQYLSSLEQSFQERVLRCGPLSNAYNATRDSFCHKVLMPVNGLWIALASCVLLLLPLQLVARRLARLYARAAPWPGARADSEYLYDAYADRDNVPLANAYKAEKRSARSSRDSRQSSATSAGRGRGARSSAGDSSVAPSVDTYHARRYNDMAPNTKCSESGVDSTSARECRVEYISMSYSRPEQQLPGTGKKDPPATSDLLSTSGPHPTTIPDHMIDSKLALAELDEDLLKY